MNKLDRWDVEDEQFWQETGKKVAYRNLWISVPNLLCGFSTWLYWGMIIKFLQKVHFGNLELFNFLDSAGNPYSGDDYKAMLFTLPAVAGLAGATLRIPNSFMIAICGGRNVKFMTTLMMIAPALATGIALRNPDVSFNTLILLAALSGVGGGAFAASMSNISFFFPKRMQGLSLGLNAGLGNAGVSVMQFLIPFAIARGLFGGFGGDPHSYEVGVATQQMWLQNAAFVWLPIMGVLAVAAFFGMNNLPQHKCGPLPVAAGKFLWLIFLGFAGTATGVFLLLADWGSTPRLLKIFIILVICVCVTLALMRLLTPKDTKAKLIDQFAIFGNKHTWVMTWLYTMTFGSFIGYSAAFPKLLDDVFGFIRVDSETGKQLVESIANPAAPVTAKYIWLGAGVGALIRPLGGWLSDKLGGARVTQWDTVVMIGATIGAGYYVSLASQSATPEQYFWPFLFLFILLFATTGIGNGSTFRMIPIIFSKEQAGPMLGWTSAIAAYGAYLIPQIFGEQIKNGTPEYALYGFAGYYGTCLAINWWFYARKNAEIPC